MNYIKIYNNLINRGKTRIIKDYYEVHHIIPRCLGGLDTADNLVRLTPEEHYLAHQLLVKIYPDNFKLTLAATMMCVEGTRGKRNNKVYGWLRKRHSEAMSKLQAGDGNSQFGTKWISNPDTGISKKIPKVDSIPYGFYLGRNLKWYNCLQCSNNFVGKTNTKYCSKLCVKHSKIKISDAEAEQLLHDYESGMPMKEILIKHNRSSEQSVTTFLRIRFPGRQKFLPRKREMHR